MKRIIFQRTTKIAIACIVLLLCCGEFFARFGLGLGDPPLSITDPEIEYMFKPNQNCRRFGNRIFINEWGMRSMPITKTKQDKTEIRIMWFGDSVINGGNQTDHDSLATTLLENELKKKWNRPVRVMNVSAGSWGPPNMLAYLKKFGDFDADIVIVTLSSHDAQDYPTFESLNPNTHPTEKPISALWEGIQRYLPRYLPASASAAPEVDYKIDPTKQELVLNDFSELLRLEKEKGKRVIVMHHWEKKELALGKTTMGRDALIMKAAFLQVKFLSDSNELIQSLKRNQQPYRDNIHLNKYGQELIAAIASKELNLWKFAGCL